jgi:leader peptidase (prepilin peptidase)/N-methyltransferase
MIPYALLAAVLIVGLCIGSFLNVCIYRIPTSLSIARPSRSICPACSTPIQWFDNIPLLSFVWLRGRCRRCRVSISVRYPLVELMTGLFAVAVVLKFGPTIAAVIYFAFAAALIVITFIDIDHQIIPDVITLWGIPILLACSFILPDLHPVDALLGVAVGGGSLYLVGKGYQLLKGQVGMGGGDIKLLAMIGAVLGWQGIVMTVFVASATGTLAGVATMAAGRSLDTKLRIPFGPFLAIGAMTHLFFGKAIIRWYIDLTF